MRKITLFCLIMLFMVSVSAASQVLDVGFGNEGKVTTPISGERDFAKSLALQSDGKIIACGSYRVGNRNQIALSRYNPDGSMDGTFGNNGISLNEYGTITVQECSIALQQSGKIVIAATYSPLPPATQSANFLLLRFNADGTQDMTFGSDGVTIVGGIGGCLSYDVAVLANQKIMLAGRSAGLNGPLLNGNISVGRFNADGTLDTAFGINGFVEIDATLHFPNVGEAATTFEIDPEGRILVAGYLEKLTSDHDFILARLNTDGTPDTAFGNNGFAVADFGGRDQATSLIITPDDKYIIGGSSEDIANQNSKIAIAKFNHNGTPDTAFGNNGQSSANIGIALSDHLQAILLLPDGKILGAGYTENPDSSNDFLFLRYNSDGNPDPTFNASGHVATDFALTDDAAFDLLMQPDGKVILAGTTSAMDSVSYDFALARYNVDDALQTTDFESRLISVYPNPVTDRLFVQPDTVCDYISVYDLQGRKVADGHQNKIQLDGLAPGTYIVTAFQRDKPVFSRKIVKK